jgi:hypothetical protein
MFNFGVLKYNRSTEVVTTVVNTGQGYNTMRAVTVLKLLLNCLLIKHNNYAFEELTHTNDQLLHTHTHTHTHKLTQQFPMNITYCLYSTP